MHIFVVDDGRTRHNRTVHTHKHVRFEKLQNSRPRARNLFSTVLVPGDLLLVPVSQSSSTAIGKGPASEALAGLLVSTCTVRVGSSQLHNINEGNKMENSSTK